MTLLVKKMKTKMKKMMMLAVAAVLMLSLAACWTRRNGAGESDFCKEQEVVGKSLYEAGKFLLDIESAKKNSRRTS